jgi:hypothetical protein
MGHRVELFKLSIVILLFAGGCERTLEPDVSTTLADSSILPNLHEPRLISPKDGWVFTTTSQILLRWSWVSTAKRYSAEVATDTLFSRVVFSTTTDTTFVRTVPLEGMRFYWRVKAHNDRTVSPWSDVRTFYIRNE